MQSGGGRGTASYEALSNLAGRHALISEGYRVLRISLFDAFAPEGVFDAVRGLCGAVECMAALRKAVGTDLQIIFEAHTRLNPPQAVELCNNLIPYRPFYYVGV